MTRNKWQYFALSDRIILAVTLLIVTYLLASSEILWRLDQVLFDAQQHTWARPAPDDVVIVEIDASSLAELGQWPWTRSRHAQLIDQLTEAGARAIALDIIFSEPETDNPTADQALAAAIRRSGRVILPVYMEQSRSGGLPYEALPLPALADGAAGLGHVHVQLDHDGIARSVYLQEGLGSPYWPNLSIAILHYLEPQQWRELPGERNPQQSAGMSTWVRDHRLIIPYAGPPGHFQRISYHRVLSGDFAADTFRDKIVLVGVTVPGLGDSLPTPVSGLSHPMPGVEINANILDAVRSGLAITEIAAGWKLLINSILIILPFVIFPQLTPRNALLASAGLILAAFVISIALLQTSLVWYSPSAVVIPLLAAYPLWSWRRLEYTLKYLNEELETLSREPGVLPSELGADKGQGMDFLKTLLPINGWALCTQNNAVIDQWGSVEVPSAPRASENWQPCGGTLHCKQLVTFDAAYVLYVNLGKDHRPDGALESLLLPLLQEHLRQEDKTVATHGEFLRTRIVKVQQASSRMRAMRSFVHDNLANMADGVIVINNLGKIILANDHAAQYLLNLPDGEQLIGLQFNALTQVLTVEQAVSWEHLFKQSLLKGEPVQFNTRHHNGMDLLIQMAPVVDHQHTGGGLIINLTNITPLRESERRRAEAIGFLSHDLRSPLVSMLAMIHLIREHRKEMPLPEMLDRFDKYANTTVTLAERFVQIMQVESGDDFAPRVLDLSMVVESAISQVWSFAEEKRIKIKLDCDAEREYLIRADLQLLERALVNLINNAVKYSPADTAVDIALTEMGETIQCHIRDHGYGIPAEDIPVIFQRFHRVKTQAHQAAKGFGLGLAFVKAVMDKHGAEIKLESAPGQGTSFYLSFARVTD
ncbi:MAG: CHASE2 domain-containing protein [Pseudomonadota bacterium]